MVTLALGITEPDESVTVPRMVPLTVCALTVRAEHADTTMSARSRRRNPAGYEITRPIMCVLRMDIRAALARAIAAESPWHRVRPHISHPFLPTHVPFGRSGGHFERICARRRP